ncbi:MAG: hypothetical protein JWP27_1011 [Flaviaesturariibacter sp.]|nr:hypothetical protein [Flaviaesturariibacter sp.]
MSTRNRVLFKSIVTPFYKENAGFFLTAFTVMFFIVNQAADYHLALIKGLLNSGVILMIVFAGWFLYARKCTAFISDRMRDPSYAFLQVLNTLPSSRRRALLLVVEAWLLLPVLLYAMLIVLVGLPQGHYVPVGLVVAFLMLICIASAEMHLKLLANPESAMSTRRPVVRNKIFQGYPFLLLAYVARFQKVPWGAIKVFTCGIVYLVVRNQSPADDDIAMAFLFFTLGIMANALLVERIRSFEETRLSFYRGSPVSLSKRFLQYAFVYAAILLPEFLTLALLAPSHLHPGDALRFALCGYGFLLLMNSLASTHDYRRKEFLKIMLLFFFVQYALLLSIGLFAAALLLIVTALAVFRYAYYGFERRV